MESALTLYEQLRDDILFREDQFPLIRDQIVTLDKYFVPIAETVRNMEKNIPKEWAGYLEILDQAEKMLDYSKVLIRGTKK